MVTRAQGGVSSLLHSELGPIGKQSAAYTEKNKKRSEPV